MRLCFYGRQWETVFQGRRYGLQCPLDSISKKSLVTLGSTPIDVLAGEGGPG